MYAMKVDENKAMQWVEVPSPVRKENEVLIEIHAAALNRADLLQREGKYPPPPGWPEWMGLEVSGVVLSARPGGRWRVGDRVCALLGGGGYAEKVAVPEEMVMRIPRGLSMADAAALPEAFATAWLNLHYEADLKSGETVLIQAGASGLGVAAIQVAKLLGAKIVTTVGSDDKAELVKKLGADIIVNRKKDDLGAAMDANPVDVVLDCVGGEGLGKNLEKLAIGGRWILIATLGGESANVPLRPILKRGLMLKGSTLRSRSNEMKGKILQDLEERVWAMIESSKIRPVIHGIFPVSKAEDAHAVLQRSDNAGKVVLAIR